MYLLFITFHTTGLFLCPLFLNQTFSDIFSDFRGYRNRPGMWNGLSSKILTENLMIQVLRSVRHVIIHFHFLSLSLLLTLDKKWSFLLRISSVNVTKSDLVTFIVEILNRKLHFLCSVISMILYLRLTGLPGSLKSKILEHPQIWNSRNWK